MRDLASKIQALSAIAPGIYKADPDAASIDRAGFESVTFLISIGVGGITFTDANNIRFKMEDSDDGVNWNAVLLSNLAPLLKNPDGTATIDTGIDTFLLINQAHPAATVNRQGYVDGYAGERRYVRVRAVFGGSHSSGTPISVTALLGSFRQAPIA
ncbi:hypothetical protein MKK63_20355 [Methylobacterium sp. J-088]|uniref:hypothetical protein n=1 Tax=Methylobacterium sp. J-088 TaxID=2836664 RepID=UPI001FB8AB09|nr:hypothetical protein [Methylobacterium sp. J-088]MCJ2065044.1 hypothetical protein [Methylobacterium sp. J-088]